MSLDAVLARIDDDLDKSLERLFTLLRFQSVSTDPAFHDQCLAAAAWLEAELASLGFQARVVETPGKPMVLAKREKPGAPHLLFYGHYDVQPPDPLEKWTSLPFEPVVEDTPENGRVIRARGASDDKGQLMTFLEAVRATLAVKGDLPVSLTVLLEGEEETGSPSLAPFLEAHGRELAADMVLVCDTNGFGPDRPSVTTRLRGLASAEVTITGPSRDLHSGHYGGAVPNPNHIAGRLVAALHDESGRVRIPGFYDGVRPVPEDLRRRWQALGFDAAGFLGDVGVTGEHGEAGFTLLERIWARPTAEVNGIIGGYTGEGLKTVIPAQARVKLTFRLVPGQQAERILASFRSFVEEMMPQGVQVDFAHMHGSDAVELDTESPAFQAAGAALEAEYGQPPAFIGMGGSIPIVQHFKERLGMPALMLGFANEDDNIHSPNEKYNLSSYHRGQRSWARVMAALGDAG